MRQSKGRISIAQEVFINELIKGKSQRNAYLEAYPNKKHWKPGSLDTEASKLFKQTKIQQRYQEILDHLKNTEQEKTKWTREQSIETLRYVIDTNKEDLERIYNAAEEELKVLLEMIKEQPERAVDITMAAIKQRQKRRVSSIHNGGIVSAVAELNKMQGFNEETINVNGNVIFEGEDQLED